MRRRPTAREKTTVVAVFCRGSRRPCCAQSHVGCRFLSTQVGGLHYVGTLRCAVAAVPQSVQLREQLLGSVHRQARCKRWGRMYEGLGVGSRCKDSRCSTTARKKRGRERQKNHRKERTQRSASPKIWSTCADVLACHAEIVSNIPKSVSPAHHQGALHLFGAHAHLAALLLQAADALLLPLPAHFGMRLLPRVLHMASMGMGRCEQNAETPNGRKARTAAANSGVRAAAARTRLAQPPELPKTRKLQRLVCPRGVADPLHMRQSEQREMRTARMMPKLINKSKARVEAKEGKGG